MSDPTNHDILSSDEEIHSHSVRPIQAQPSIPDSSLSQSVAGVGSECELPWLSFDVHGLGRLNNLYGGMPAENLLLQMRPQCAMQHSSPERMLFYTMDPLPVLGDIYTQPLPSPPPEIMHSYMPPDAQYATWLNSQVDSSTRMAMQAEPQMLAVSMRELPLHAADTSELPPTDREVRTIIGEPSLFFESNAGNHVGIGTMLSHDLRSVIDGEYRGYLSGFKSKVTYVIVANPAFHTDPAFQAWPAGSNIENFALVELRKISRASIQIILDYLPAVDNWVLA
ncbi:hypothetical protein EIP86_009726 [Pleurotus ostreatoroseus]|nr:hypothetical protein EIP86_009726 [Pleurotus ostreatoroseus]